MRHQIIRCWKALLVVILLCRFALDGWAQQGELPSYVHFYQFNNRFIDLQTLEQTDKIDFPAQGWKYAGRYAYRYQRLSIDKLGFRGKLFEILPNNGLKMTDMNTQAALSLPNKELNAERGGQSFMITCKDGVLYIKHLNHAYGFRVYKYDATGSELFGVGIPHSELVRHGTLEYQRPYLRYFAHTGWQVVFVSYESGTPKTHILNTADGSLESYDFTIQGIIRDEAEDNFIQGFIYWSAADKQWKLRYQGNETVMELPSSDIRINCMETVVAGNTLYIAAYATAERGCQLWAYDLTKKIWLWNKAVSTPVAKTNDGYYHNTVWLSRYEDKLLLEGFERDGKYFHIFNAGNGNLLKTWD